MATPPAFVETYQALDPDEPVVFSVLCRPESGIDLDEFKKRLSLSQVKGLKPSDEIRRGVASGLRSRGFEVLDDRGPVVFARGTASQFRETFGGELVKLTRRPRDARSMSGVTSIVVRPNTAPPSASAIDGALLVALAEPPLLAAPRVPQASPQFCLHLPGDIAQLTGASATHRLLAPSGASATGRGVTVAVIDTGFADHPYFADHDYRVTRLAAPDAQDPEVDEGFHGTYVLANLLACAPDVDAYAIKWGQLDLAFWTAMQVPGVKVISLSWYFSLDPAKAVPDWLVALEFLILVAVNDWGITVVVAAGNWTPDSFPALMPDVIAVGGVTVGPDDSICAWEGTSSFVSPRDANRSVPDLCGIASEIMLPVPESAAGLPFGWHVSTGATSCAAPQVAGIAALLLQKTPTLTPQGVRAALLESATDVTCGQTRTGAQAGPGWDLATGEGLVNAQKAWAIV